jgi:hypothetical protein
LHQYRARFLVAYQYFKTHQPPTTASNTNTTPNTTDASFSATPSSAAETVKRVLVDTTTNTAPSITKRVTRSQTRSSTASSAPSSSTGIVKGFSNTINNAPSTTKRATRSQSSSNTTALSSTSSASSSTSSASSSTSSATITGNNSAPNALTKKERRKLRRNARSAYGPIVTNDSPSNSHSEHVIAPPNPPSKQSNTSDGYVEPQHDIAPPQPSPTKNHDKNDNNHLKYSLKTREYDNLPQFLYADPNPTTKVSAQIEKLEKEGKKKTYETKASDKKDDGDRLGRIHLSDCSKVNLDGDNETGKHINLLICCMV